MCQPKDISESIIGIVIHPVNNNCNLICPEERKARHKVWNLIKEKLPADYSRQFLYFTQGDTLMKI